MKIIPVILAGGNGKRFWPLSRENKPKQILPILSKNPLIKDCYNRFVEFDPVYIVTNEEIYNTHYKSLLPAKIQYIFEPCSRNTAPAVAWTAYSILRTLGDCIIVIDTADHYYGNETQYIETIIKGAKYAESINKIILIGTKIQSPHVGYGYLEIQNEDPSNYTNELFGIKQFIEKPDLMTAHKFMESKDHFWNTSIIITKCSVILKEYANILPHLYHKIKKIYEIRKNTKEFTKLFASLPNISISYALFEKSQALAGLISDLIWDDVGDFNALLRIYPLDGNKNFSVSNLYAFNSRHNLVTTKKPVVLIGVSNQVVIERDDVIFVCNQNETQRIKEILPLIQKNLR